jgi:hypothetical protein
MWNEYAPYIGLIIVVIGLLIPWLFPEDLDD